MSSTATSRRAKRREQPLGPTQEALLRITEAIATAVSLDELLMLALHEMAALFKMPNGSILLLDAEGTRGRIACELPIRSNSTESLDTTDNQILQQLDDQYEPLVLTSEQIAQAPQVIRRMCDGLQATTLLLLPLFTQDRLIGVLGLNSAGAQQHFNDEQLTLARVLSAQLALAITTASLYDDARIRKQELDTLNEIASTVTSSLDSHEIYRTIVQKLNEFFSVDAGSILLLDEATDELVFVMTIEAGTEKLAGWRVPPGQGVVGHVARTQQAYIVHDANNDPLFYNKVSEAVGFVTRNILCVPMLVKGRTIGVIELLNKLDGDFTQEDTDKLNAMATTVAVAIDNARLFQEIDRGRNRLQALLNSTEDGILMIDTSDVVVTANPMLQKLFGLPWEELIGQPGTLVQEQIAARTRILATPRAMSSDGEQLGEVTDLEVLEPSRRYIRRVQLPVTSDGEVIGRLVVFHDITEEHELERMREDWTGMLVHDLRSPLTAILNGLTMIRRGLVGEVNDTQREILAMTNNSGQDMLGMINTLLDIGKLEAGQMKLEREPCLLYDIADSAIERVHASARSADIEVINELPPGLPPVEMDREKMLRVLQNLLDNAIKFTPSRGAVFLSAQIDGDQYVTISVRDTGPGIPPAFRERIFEKFGQVEGERKVKGTGLGLTFCKLAVEAHGGTIWVESEEGQGSTFAFKLPIKPPK